MASCITSRTICVIPKVHSVSRVFIHFSIIISHELDFMFIYLICLFNQPNFYCRIFSPLVNKTDKILRPCMLAPVVCGMPSKQAFHLSPNNVQRTSTAQKAIIHQLTTMLATSKHVPLPGHRHLLTTGTDNLTLWLSLKHQRVKGHQYRWLAGGYDLEIAHF